MITRFAFVVLIAAAPGTFGQSDTGFSETHWEERVQQVNEGRLRFLVQTPVTPVHHHANRIVIDASSLRNGWVTLEQCHSNLDPVSETQIVFHPERVRAIEILESFGIGDARVEGASVQLRDVGRGARLCLRADSRALHSGAGGSFQLRNGPYMRRFLDGYYPMRVSLDIRYPPDELTLVGLDPQEQPGFLLLFGPGRIEADAWFEGRLFTRFTFSRSGTAN